MNAVNHRQRPTTPVVFGQPLRAAQRQHLTRASDQRVAIGTLERGTAAGDIALECRTAVAQRCHMRISHIAHVHAAMQAIQQHAVGRFRETARHADHPHIEIFVRHFLQRLLGGQLGAVIHGPGLRHGLLIHPGALPRRNGMSVQRRRTGKHHPAYARLACKAGHGLGALHVDSLELAVAVQPHVWGMQRGRMDHRIHAFQRSGQQPHIGNIADMARGRKRTAVDPDYLVARGQRAEDGAPDPA